MVASVRVTLARMWWRRATAWTGTAAGAWANIKQMDVIGTAFLPAKEHWTPDGKSALFFSPTYLTHRHCWL
ncbi:hypothetical protein KC335_g19 [Hortaea werneckii]|nr:hypothetical protein KC335_g19 [Hortaea werneckii]